MSWRLTLMALVLSAGAAHADPVTLRIAHTAPEGSSWARELAAASRELDSLSGQQIHLKIYPGAVAGDEREAAERVLKGQLDGLLSGGPVCQQVAPTMVLLRLPGLFEDGDEARFVLERMRPQLEAEARRSGYVLLVTGGLGPDIFFLRRPVRSMAEMKTTPLWRWSEEPVAVGFAASLGLKIVATPVNEAARAYAKGNVDGFSAVPVAALVFGWSTQAKYYLPDLRMSYLMGCILISSPSWGRLSYEQQQLVSTVLAKYGRRLNDVSREQDVALLGGLFEKQGLQRLPVSEKLRADFYQAARELRDHLDEKVVSKATLDHVQRLLFDYRNEHRH